MPKESETNAGLTSVAERWTLLLDVKTEPMLRIWNSTRPKNIFLIMFVTGSNDLSNGKGLLTLYNEMIGYAKQYLENVVIAQKWSS